MRLTQRESPRNDFGNKRHSFSHLDGQPGDARKLGTMTKTKMLIISDLPEHWECNGNQKPAHIGREIAHC